VSGTNAFFSNVVSRGWIAPQAYSVGSAEFDGTAEFDDYRAQHRSTPGGTTMAAAATVALTSTAVGARIRKAFYIAAATGIIGLWTDDVIGKTASRR
jgi:hypothetical protein